MSKDQQQQQVKSQYADFVFSGKKCTSGKVMENSENRMDFSYLGLCSLNIDLQIFLPHRMYTRTDVIIYLHCYCVL
jgi:hypothetical protein